MMRRAFTLVEIMVAVLVVILGVIPVYYLLTSGTRGVRWSIRQVQAVNHCSAILELFKGMNYSDITAMTSGDVFSAEQKGYMIYSQELEQWVNGGASGNWEVNGSKQAKKFFDKLNPAATPQDEILPPLEAYFTVRKVEVNCAGNNLCIVDCRVEWKRQEGSGGSHSLNFKTVVTNSLSAGEYGDQN